MPRFTKTIFCCWSDKTLHGCLSFSLQTRQVLDKYKTRKVIYHHYQRLTDAMLMSVSMESRLYELRYQSEQVCLRHQSPKLKSEVKKPRKTRYTTTGSGSTLRSLTSSSKSPRFFLSHLSYLDLHFRQAASDFRFSSSLELTRKDETDCLNIDEVGSHRSSVRNQHKLFGLFLALLITKSLDLPYGMDSKTSCFLYSSSETKEENRLQSVIEICQLDIYDIFFSSFRFNPGSEIYL